MNLRQRISLCGQWRKAERSLFQADKVKSSGGVPCYVYVEDTK